MAEQTEVVLVARTATGSAAYEELIRAASQLVAAGVASKASYAFTEQGEPSLRDRLRERIDAGARSLVLVPMLVPMEPSFASWIGKAVARWRAEDGRSWPRISLAPALLDMPQIRDLLVSSVGAAQPLPKTAVPPARSVGSKVPAQKRRVLVCHGAPCVAEGAALVWGYLRSEQARLSLRTTGEGMMSAKTTCLGPCNLAPVVQIWPEGTNYGGVDEAGVDSILGQHILSGRVASDYAYPADERKHVLRPKPPGK